MKVILLEDVKSLGKKGDVVNVSDGYARNYILPRKLGAEANAKNLNDLRLKKEREERIAKQQLDQAKELAEKLGSVGLELSVRAGENGKVFGSVSTKEIAAALKEQYGLEVDKKKIQLDEPIKEIGLHEVDVRLHKDVTATIKVRVTGI